MYLDAKEIGNRIKTYRKKRHLTQKELAEKIGCAEMTISQWERGLYTPKADLRVALADALEAPYADLFMDRTPMVFSSPEEFLKARYGNTGEKDGTSETISTAYGDHVINKVEYTFKRSNLTASELDELNNYYSYLMYKRNQAPTQDPEE